MRVRCIGDGPLVVKLAGMAGGVGLLAREAERVARSGFRVALLDTAGDRADDPVRSRITWDLLASEVLRGLDELGAERPVLWGTSFGCLVALATAAREPQRIRALLLSNPPDPGRRPAWQGRILEWVETRRDPARTADACFRIGFRAMAGWEVLYPTTLSCLPWLYRVNKEAATPASTLLGKFRLLVRERPGLPPPESKMPVTILASRWDLATPLPEARRLSRALGARLVIIDFAGHFASNSRPRASERAAVEALRRFVE